MMNKAIVGGILVAVMGGVPGATYLLTRDSEDKNTSLRGEDQSNGGPLEQVPAGTNSNADTVESGPKAGKNPESCTASDTSVCTNQPLG